MMLTEIPQLFPTPLLGGESGATISPPDDDRLVTGSMTMFPTPLLRGFARSGGPADPLFAGSMTMNPTPLMRGFASLEQRVSPLLLSLYPTPLQRGFASLEERTPTLPLMLYPTPQKDGFVSDSTRVTDYVEQDAYGTSTTSDTVYTAEKSITMTSAVLENATWVFFATCSANTSLGSQQVRTRFRNSTDSVVFGMYEGGVYNSSTDTPCSFVGIQTFGAAPGDKTLAIECNSVFNGIAVKTNNNRILAIKLTSDDAYVFDASALAVDTSFSNWKTAATLNYPVAGDFDVFAWGVHGATANNLNDIAFELLDNAGSRDKFVQSSALVSTTKRTPQVLHSEKLSVTAGQNAMTRIRHPSGSGTADFMENRGILMLNRNRWRKVGYANDPNTLSVPGTSYVDRGAAVLTDTLLAGDTIVWGNGTQYLQTGSTNMHLKMLYDSTLVGEGAKSGGNNAGGDRAWLAFKKVVATAGSHTIKWQYKETIDSGSIHGDFKFADVGYWQI